MSYIENKERRSMEQNVEHDARRTSEASDGVKECETRTNDERAERVKERVRHTVIIMYVRLLLLPSDYVLRSKVVVQFNHSSLRSSFFTPCILLYDFLYW